MTSDQHTDQAASKRIESGGTDITESVQILYDIAHSSMDWGSGFLDNAEMETVVQLAIFMGWDVPDLPDNSPAMLSVAAKYPDHYEVEETHWPATTTSGGYHFNAHTRVRIKTKKSEG